LGEALPQLLQDLKLPPIAAVYSSPFLRCRQTAAGLSSKSLSIRVELGLGESVNENWYRSWAVPGTDGTWGYQKKEHPELGPETLHPAAQTPVQPLLDWKAAITDPATKERMDDDYVSKSSLEMPYSLRPPKFESFRMQRDRMAQTMTRLSNDLVNETIVLVSHGKKNRSSHCKRRFLSS
jgi:broad specificity phosphatase PhoE